MRIRAALRTKAVTVCPRSSACCTSACPVPPEAPKITKFMFLPLVAIRARLSVGLEMFRCFELAGHAYRETDQKGGDRWRGGKHDELHTFGNGRVTNI